MMEIIWKPRENGVIAKSNTFSNKKVEKLYPFLLLDFYESNFKYKF